MSEAAENFVLAINDAFSELTRRKDFVIEEETGKSDRVEIKRSYLNKLRQINAILKDTSDELNAMNDHRRKRRAMIESWRAPVA